MGLVVRFKYTSAFLLMSLGMGCANSNLQFQGQAVSAQMSVSALNPGAVGMDTSKLQSVGNQIQLTPLNQTDQDGSANGFGRATNQGVVWDGTESNLIIDPANTTNLAELDPSWTPEWNNLYGYFTFDPVLPESSRSGRGVALTVDAAGTRIPGGKLGYAYSFNSSTKLQLSTVGFVDGFAASQGITVGTWIYIPAGAASNGIYYPIFTTEDVTNRKGFAFEIFNGALVLFTGHSSTAGDYTILTSPNSLPTNAWVHVAFSIAPNTATSMYVNGVRVAGNSSSYFAVSSGQVSYVGYSDHGPTNFINGAKIDDLAIWSVVLTPAEIQTIYSRQSAQVSGIFQSRVMDAGAWGAGTANWSNIQWTTTLPFAKNLSPQLESSSSYSALTGNSLSTGLVGLWHFDDASTATFLQDGLGLGQRGNRNAPAPHVTLGTPGLLGNSVSFDGNASAYVTATVSSNPGTNYSFGAWVKMDNQAQTSKIIQINDAYTVVLYVNTSGQAYCHSSSNVSTPPNTPSVVVPLGTWTHLMCAVDTNSITLYVNGVPQAVSVNPLATWYLTTAVIGTSLAGSVDEVAVWSRTLSAAEVLQLYRRGVNRIKFQVRTCADSSCSTGNPSWVGPDGTNQSYFTENNSNSTSNPLATFNLSANEYFQYRAILESDDTSRSCSYQGIYGICSPELTSVSIGPNHYDNSSPSVTSTVPLPFPNLASLGLNFGDSGCPGGITMNLSPDGNSWYYWTGSAWSLSSGAVSQSSPATDINAHLSSFEKQTGTGKLFTKEFLNSNGSQPCSISSLQFSGFNF